MDQPLVKTNGQSFEDTRMKKLRVGVVGLGTRGRDVLKLTAKFDCVEIAVRTYNWFDQQ